MCREIYRMNFVFEKVLFIHHQQEKCVILFTLEWTFLKIER